MVLGFGCNCSSLCMDDTPLRTLITRSFLNILLDFNINENEKLIPKGDKVQS